MDGRAAHQAPGACHNGEVTPADGDRGDGIRLPGQRPTLGPAAAAELRRKHVRRRVVAAGVVVLLIAWLAGLNSAGRRYGAGSHRLAGLTPSAAARQLAVIKAEQQRQDRALDAVQVSLPFVTAGGAEQREIALTFDDGPSPFTPKVLEILQRMNVPATFFVVGTSLRYFGNFVPQELAGGFVVGDHTQHHYSMAVLSAKDQAAELSDQAAAIKALGAPAPRLFRPPYGSFNHTTLVEARRQNMVTVLWSIDTKDFSRPGTGTIVQTVLREAKPGAIVLMHDGGGPRTQTVEALQVIIGALRRRGFKLVTVPQLLADDPPQAPGAVPFRSGGG